MEYNKLPELTEVAHCPERLGRACSSLRELEGEMKSHSLAITITHRHHNLAPGQKLVWSKRNSSYVAEPVEIETDDCVNLAWKLGGTGAAVPFEFCRASSEIAKQCKRPTSEEVVGKVLRALHKAGLTEFGLTSVAETFVNEFELNERLPLVEDSDQCTTQLVPRCEEAVSGMPSTWRVANGKPQTLVSCKPCA